MKNIFTKSVKFLLVFCSAALVFFSCEYKEIGDATYPDQKIYMPAALKGNFVINDVPTPTLAVPTPGQPFKLEVDQANKLFIVPLGVYRSGINNNGSFNVDIAVNNDTINKLLAIAGKLPAGTILLNSNKFTIPSSVVMQDGKELAGFDLSIPLDSLRNNPNKIYALGITISSTSRVTNPKFATTILVIYTVMLKPVANFTFVVNATDTKARDFTNTSVYGTNYTWDFGDGTAPLDATILIKPTHTYAAAGTYTVTLTAVGVTGVTDQSIKTSVVTVL